MNEVVTLPVQVHAFGGNVSGEQNSHTLLFEREVLDDFHLLHVGQAAVQHIDLRRLELGDMRQRSSQPFEGGVTLGEDHDSRVTVGPNANLCELVGERVELAGVAVVDLVVEIGEDLQRGEFDIALRVCFAANRFGPVLDGFTERLMRRQERFQQRVRKQLLCFATHRRLTR